MTSTSAVKQPTDDSFRRVTVDLSSGFTGTPDKVRGPMFTDFSGVSITRNDLVHVTQRMDLRGLLFERMQGTTLDDYVLSERAYMKNSNVQLPRFITPEFWQELW